ncbi:PD-(D/E)XK nuclease family protein [Candidatus Woesearchaeota archaeon]|nr:PD-(D/E)XK nuclease family protein [Candidatus Woesearchaeota archaeon]
MQIQKEADLCDLSSINGAISTDSAISMHELKQLPQISPQPIAMHQSIPSHTSLQSQFKRIQSPSSINTYKQCPRKYYYQYMKKLPTKSSIHLVRGKLSHAVLEDFFKIDNSIITAENYSYLLKILINDLFKKHWSNSQQELDSLGLSTEDYLFYFNETQSMINGWIELFIEKLNKELQQYTLYEAFKRLTPLTEIEYSSANLGVRGFVDAIFEHGEHVKIMDYKTSKKDQITEEYKLQLGIYALLYQQKHGITPRIVGIDFLKHGERFIEVDDKLLQFARKECELIHIKTQSDNVKEYPKKISSLCKWSTGQCDFYGTCVKSE